MKPVLPRLLALLLALAWVPLAPLVQAQAPKPAIENLVLPCGLLGGKMVVSQPESAFVIFLDVEKEKLAGKVEIKPEEIDDRCIKVERRAGEGMVLALAKVVVSSGRSLSRYDYALEINGKRYEALAIGLSKDLYDERLVTVQVPASVKQRDLYLLFELPKGTSEALWVSALPQTLSFPPTPVTVR